jgi:arylsulfatase A-like enzyme
MATNDHAPAGRGWEHHLIYFDGANDYWTSSEGNCGRAAMTDLWLNSAPAKGLNNSYSCSQAHQPASCVYEDAMFLQQTLDAIKGRDTSRPYFQIWAPHNIHAPLQVPAAYLSNFSFIADPNRQAYVSFAHTAAPAPDRAPPQKKRHGTPNAPTLAPPGPIPKQAAKVRYIDDALAQVVAALKAAGMWENTLFVC